MKYTVHSVKPFKGDRSDKVIDVTFHLSLWNPLDWMDYLVYPSGRYQFVGSSTVWYYLSGPYKNSRCSTFLESLLSDVWSADKRGLL
jgi:hypothetical protein